MNLVKVTTDNYTVGFESNGEIVVRAHRYMKFLLGKSESLARSIISKNQWKASIVPERNRDAVRESLLGKAPLEIEIAVTPDPDTLRSPVDASKRFVQQKCFCGEPALFGFGYSRGEPGRWFCHAHAVLQNKAAA